uniref:Si:ch211-244c8.4 n=1 Tax=Sander lucioperca TaxID=283035 RepID=A0A8D0DBU2_SANLU
MDVQTENMDPLPCESQSSGKIRKGFKLFGKRKPGNIFSIRSKGDGNNKSPVIRSTTIDGLSETAAQDLEQELDREKGQEVSQGEMEQAEEEPLGEDGTLAAAPARASISSASSAKSLSFLSLLRGGRRGVGDRRVHTVSQPVGRHRRGLKGLFDNVRFRSKDKEKEEAPPSPLLMSSRANSVEIIKEDLTLTPKFQPRSLDSPETESCDPEKSLTTQDSVATSPSETISPQGTAGNVSRTNKHVPPLPTSEPPLVPGDNSLSCLLADISSLLTFDSISGGGDIMADVEAEWGKASSPIGAVVTEVTPSSTSLFSKPTISTPLTSASVNSVSKAPPAPTPVPCPVTSLPSTPATCPSEAPVSAKMKEGSGQASVDGQLTSPKELHNESQKSLQGPSRERRIPQAKASGLSKIPVVGGGRAGKLPVRDSQHVDDEACRDPPTPVREEERPHFNSHDAGSKDKIGNVETNVPTSKHTQEESQQLPQPKVLTSLPRDSKIPVKHGAQSHTASQIPQAKEPSRTKIPVSKVPVRRAGNKPAAAGGSTQIRK